MEVYTAADVDIHRRRVPNPRRKCDEPRTRPATLERMRGEPLRCPNDGSRLVELDRSDVLIDACPECRGVWLDRGELDKILVKERQFAAGMDADQDFYAEMGGRTAAGGSRSAPPTDRYDDQPEKKRKRRSFLEDILDFD
jgi:Zn-finger nucleic acid-binding protein